MKPTTRVINYVTLVQDGVMAIEDVPSDARGEVTKWLRYFSGISDNGMVKDTVQETASTQPAKPEVQPTTPTEPTQVTGSADDKPLIFNN